MHVMGLKRRDAVADSFRECHVQESKFKTFFVALLLRNDAFHNRQSPFHTQNIFHCESVFFAFLCSIDFSLSHDFNCICSSSSFPSLLQQSAILMQMTTFYFYSIDCECLEPDGESGMVLKTGSDE